MLLFRKYSTDFYNPLAFNFRRNYKAIKEEVVISFCYTICRQLLKINNHSILPVVPGASFFIKQHRRGHSFRRKAKSFCENVVDFFHKSLFVE